MRYAGMVCAAAAVGVVAVCVITGAADRPSDGVPAASRPASSTAPVVKTVKVRLAKMVQIPDTVVEFEMVRVPGGRITIKGADGKERAHEVKPFWIGAREVTWDEYEIYYLGLDLPRDEAQRQIAEHSRPSKPFQDPTRGWGRHGSPAGSITSMEAEAYAKWLSAKTGKTYRLPTDAEWEWACRAGTAKALRPADAPAAKRVAWYFDNSDEQTHPVGKLEPNAWGLYDMLGNVAEWVTLDDGTPAAAGGSFRDAWDELNSGMREPYRREWQVRDCQEPKSRHWLTDGMHVGIRVVRED